MTKSKYSLWVIIAGGLFFLSLSALAEKPNIIFIYTDDHGWPDLSCQGVLKDVKTPHTDELASSGVRFTSGYSSAPQCRPARAGLMSGRYQNRFGLEDNRHLALPWSEYTVAERLRDAGYITGQSGKWHLKGPVDSLGKNPDGSEGSEEDKKNFKTLARKLKEKDPGEAYNHGFTEHLTGSLGTYVASHSPAGKPLGEAKIFVDKRYRVDVQAEWGVNFIKRHAGKKPFFLFLSLYAPHVPLEAPQKYLDRFPGEMPERRRLALAMISSVDDAVGQVRKTLKEKNVLDNTLIFYISDNGAPLKIEKKDAPGGGPGWDGSLNDPWIGEKGMLTEGGIRVPFIVSWPSKIPAGKVDARSVISLDATATAVAAAGKPVDKKLDGVDLLPFLDGRKKEDPHEFLYWRWAGQYAVRSGKWKYLKAGDRSYLFDVTSDKHETQNLIAQNPEKAELLKGKITKWSNELHDPGFDHPVGYAGEPYFDFYLDGKRKGNNQKAVGTKPEASSKNKAQNFLKLRDSNNDGELTLKEFIGNPEGRNVPVLTKRFKSMDTDGNLKVSLSELQSTGKKK